MIKQKIKTILSQIYSIYLFYLFSVKFTFFKNLNNWKLTDLSFKSKQKDLIEFYTELELFHDETERIKATNEDQKKDIEDRNVVLRAAFKLHNMLLEIYTN